MKQKIKAYFNENRTGKICTLAGIGVCIAAFITCYCLFGNKLLNFVENKAAFEAWLESYGGFAGMIFVAIRALQTVIKIIPAEPLEIASGYAFGTFGGLGYCMLGTFLGSLVIIALTKLFGTKLVSVFVPKNKIEEYAFLKDKNRMFSLLFIIYLIPGTPKDIITYLFAMTNGSIPLFLLITSIARVPSIITSTWCGGELGNGNYTSAIAIFVSTAVAGALAMLLYRKKTAVKDEHVTQHGIVRFYEKAVWASVGD